MNALSPFWKVTSSGVAFDFVNPVPEMIDISTIAHELAMTSRWGGNVAFTYSVAQHSMLVAQAIARPEWRIYGLLHDAAEAYTGDIVTPFKAYLESKGADIIGLERRILQCVWTRFGLAPPLAQKAEAVDTADARVLATEYRDVVKGRSSRFQPKAPPLSARIRPMNVLDAEDRFLEAFGSMMELAHA